MLEARLLGQFDVRRDGGRIEIPSRPSQSLLAYLLLHIGIPQRREKLAGMFWPDANESNARNNLRHSLWRIRKAIGEPHLEADNIAVSVPEGPGLWVDALQLERPSPADADLSDLEQSCEAYGGELLPGFYEDWVIMDRERIRVAFERRTHILLERLLAQSSWTKAIDWAERWVVLGHSPEAAFRAMMVAHAGLGDIASVAATYRRCADTLTRDLGVEPSPLTRETFERLSRGGVPGTRASVATVPATEQTVEEGLRRLLASWRRAKADVLDLPHLAMLHAWPGESAMEAEDASLVLRSALHHGIDWEPWMRFASSDAARAGILRGYYETYPRPPVRLRIVDALRSLPRPSAQPALEKVLEADDAPEVSEAAALGLASLGAQEAAVAALRRRGAHGSDPAGVHALVAVADVMDRPVRVAFDTGVPLALLVGLRRWKSARREALRQAARAALGAGIASAANGLLSPWYASLGPGRGFQETLEFVSIPGWMIGGALGFLVIGGAQGLATALLVGAADACWRGNRRLALRVLLGGFSGLVHTGFLLLATSTAVAAPTSPASVYVPGFLLYGWILGASLSFVIPSLEARRGWKVQLIRAGWVAAFLGLFTLAFGAIVHVDEAVGELVRRVAFAVLLPIGLAIGASTRSNFALRDTPEVR